MKYGYARKSTAKQALDAQVATLKELGAEEVIQETGSGRKDRKGFTALVARLQKGDTLMATEISRLGRDDRALLKLRDDSLARGYTIQIGAQAFDFTTTGDWLSYSLQAVIYAGESRTVGSRVKRAATAREGQPSGPQGGRPKALNPQQEAWVRKQYAEGKGYAWLVKRYGVSKTTIQRIIKGRAEAEATASEQEETAA